MNKYKKKLQEEALIKKDKLIMRSCWNCNPSHEHLKTCEVPIVCYQCGHYYYKGVDITDE